MLSRISAENFTVNNMNLLDVVFANSYDVTVATSDFELIVPDIILLCALT
jgi:hypothetical protein